MDVISRSFLARGLLIIILSGPVTPASAAPAAGRLTLGVHPYLQTSDLFARFSPLADHLAAKLGRPVSVEIAGTYQEHIDRCGRGDIDLAFFGPASYVKLVATYGKRPILGAVEVQGKHTFQGVIITQKDRPLRGLRDLRGRSFAFGDPNSTMAHLVPRSMLLQAGIGLKDLGQTAHLSNHDNIALGVLAGDFDAGAVKLETFERYRERGLRQLARTPEIADHLFVVCSGLPSPVVSSARSALLGLTNEPAGPGLLRTLRHDLTGMAAAQDRDYDPLRRIIERLKKAGIEP